MKADSKHNFVLVLIGLTIILSIYLIVTNKEKFTALQEYKKKNPWRISVEPGCLKSIHRYYGDRKGGMSWEGNLKVSPKARAIQELMYRRDCPTPLISQMPKYHPPFLPNNPAIKKP